MSAESPCIPLVCGRSLTDAKVHLRIGTRMFSRFPSQRYEDMLAHVARGHVGACAVPLGRCTYSIYAQARVAVSARSYCAVVDAIAPKQHPAARVLLRVVLTIIAERRKGRTCPTRTMPASRLAHFSAESPCLGHLGSRQDPKSAPGVHGTRRESDRVGQSP